MIRLMWVIGPLEAWASCSGVLGPTDGPLVEAKPGELARRIALVSP